MRAGIIFHAKTLSDGQIMTMTLLQKIILHTKFSTHHDIIVHWDIYSTSHNLLSGKYEGTMADEKTPEVPV